MFRDYLPFHDVPIKLHLRGKRRDDSDAPDADKPVAVPNRRAKPIKLKEPPKGRKAGAKGRAKGEAVGRCLRDSYDY